MALLEIKNLHKRFGGLHAVNDVSVAIERGTIKAVIGPNGAGKTTLFNLISGSLHSNGGTVLFNGDPIHGLPPHLIARKGIARTYQNIKLFHKMSVLENVMVGRHIRSRAGMISAFFSFPRTWKEEKQIADAARKYLSMLGIGKLADNDASGLSFGQQRAVELARALALEPVLLMLDEPAAGLTMHETAELAAQIRSIRDGGVTVLIIEHDMSLVMDISDDIAVLCFGQKIAEGKPRQIQRDPEVIRVYLGEDDGAENN